MTEEIEQEIPNKPKKRYTDTVMSPEGYRKMKADKQNRQKSKQKRK